MGHQKGQQKRSKECPCCGWHDETQLHIMQCTHTEMQKTSKTAFEECQKYYHQRKVPAMVYIPFVRLMKAICDGRDPTVNSQMHPAAQAAVDSQVAIGGKLTLPGYLTDKWFEAIQLLAPDKSDQKLSHLYLGLWQHIFRPTWDQRNLISHGMDSVVTRAERAQLLTELDEWKRMGPMRLGHQQQYLLQYSYRDIRTWTNSTLRNTANMLTTAAVNYRKSEHDPTQRLITGYFTLTNLDTSDGEPTGQVESTFKTNT